MLLTEKWLPVRTRQGGRRWVSPDELSDSDLIAFDAVRADFNGALFQFARSLLQTTSPVDSAMDWRDAFKSPPDSATLRQWFQPVAQAFVYEGDGPRFMQDLSLPATEDFGVASLLIDSPGENGIKNNTDHFVKRGRVRYICPHCAITALLTLQINAPAGGAGQRTGLRGGGPLTTVVLCQPPKSLWHDLWLNVMTRTDALAHSGNPSLSELHFTFPWMADVSVIQKDGGETAPLQVHPFHQCWAMPRRIRLQAASATLGVCDLCHRDGQRLLSHYGSKPYGFNYKGPWDHVLSPYYEAKEGWLPLHPQPGGFGYRHWPAWVLGAGEVGQRQRPATMLTYFIHQRRQALAGVQMKLWAFGFDLDNMKARCWYEASMPLYGLDACAPHDIKHLEYIVGQWLAAAKLALYALRSAVKSAWFGGDARGDFSSVDAAFWDQTEASFYAQLKKLVDAARTGEMPAEASVTNALWLKALTSVALRLFDDVFVGAGPIERQHPQRAANAHKLLRKTLSGPKLKAILGLPVADVTSGATPKPTKKTAAKKAVKGGRDVDQAE